jgi:F-type H+-transporting ATPase subunit epsilon
MLTFELVTLDGVKHSSECYEVILPTAEGQIAIFPHHASLVSVASPGVVSVRQRATDGDELLQHFATDGGVIEINDRRVRLLTDEAEAADDIYHTETQAALARARELAAQADDKVATADATALIERRLAQLKVTELSNRKRNR